MIVLLLKQKLLGGTNAHLERMLCHKCNWLVCACHTNKLPLRHLIEKVGKFSQNLVSMFFSSPSSLDGKTSSKDGFTGPIGKLLSSVTSMEVNYNFRYNSISVILVNNSQCPSPLPGGEDLHPLPPDILKEQSTDACVSYQYCHAVKTGILPPELAELKPGKIVHSRSVLLAPLSKHFVQNLTPLNHTKSYNIQLP